MAALRRGEEVVFADEMRLGQVRRVWGRRGEKQRRLIELRYEWGVLGVRRGPDAGAAVVGLGEAGAGGGNSSGAQSVEGDRSVV